MKIKIGKAAFVLAYKDQIERDKMTKTKNVNNK